MSLPYHLINDVSPEVHLYFYWQNLRNSVVFSLIYAIFLTQVTIMIWFPRLTKNKQWMKGLDRMNLRLICVVLPHNHKISEVHGNSSAHFSVVQFWTYIYIHASVISRH